VEERHKWLRKIALDHLDSPRDFWKKMDALPTLRTEVPPAARKALEQSRTGRIGSIPNTRGVSHASTRKREVDVNLRDYFHRLVVQQSRLIAPLLYRFERRWRQQRMSAHYLQVPDSAIPPDDRR